MTLNRNFGDLNFVTGLRVLEGVEFKNRINFSPSGQDWLLHSMRFAFCCKILKNLTKNFQELTPAIFNLNEDLVITGVAFKRQNGLSVVAKLHRPIGS